MSMVHRIAAIDIGTVTTRLLIADVGSDGIDEVYRSTDITHLGEDLTATGRLGEAAMQRVGDVIAEYERACREHGVERIVAMATSASRDAENGDEFRAMLAGLGIEPEIIEGLREAELSFSGATYRREGEGILVVDCGGGSTELVLGDVLTDSEGRTEQRIEAARSIDVGSRRMSERFLKSDPPTRAELDDARAWAVSELRPFFDRLDERAHLMLALAGTATSLAAIRIGLAEYDPERVDGFELDGSDISDLLDTLDQLSLAQRRQVVGLHPDRAGVIVAGALILETVMALAGLDRMVVSESDILYGILLDAHRGLIETDAGAGE